MAHLILSPRGWRRWRGGCRSEDAWTYHVNRMRNIGVGLAADETPLTRWNARLFRFARSLLVSVV